jgi:pilus assembly protein FimV
MFWRSALAVALLCFVASSKVFALGLGDIEITSVLNNPLKAVVELTSATDAELEELKVNIASSEAFARVGVTRSRILNDFSFDVGRSPSGKPVIRISTTEPVRDAFLEFLLEVVWSKGRLVRQYTVLVDPPYTMPVTPVAPRPPVIPAPPAVRVQPAAPSPEAPPRVTPAPPPPPRQVTPAPAPPPPPVATAPEPAATTDQYGPVRRSETLWDIAKQLRPGSDISMQQMMLALQRANPEAFTDNNINNLRAGAVLRVPDRDEMLTMSRSDSLRETRRQYDEWRAARSATTAAVQEAQAEASPAAIPGSAPGQVTETRLQLVAPEADAIVGAADTGEAEAQAAQEDAPADGDVQQQLALATEEAEAGRAQSEELQSRVSKLEEQVESMKRLLELKDAQLASMQNRLAQEEELPVASTAEPEAEPLAAADELPVAAEQESAVTPDAESTPAEEPAPVAETVEDASDTGMPGRLVDRLLDNPVLSGLGVLVAMVLGGFLWASTRQRKNDDVFGGEPTMESQLADLTTEHRQEPVIPVVAAMEQEGDEEAANQPEETGTLVIPDAEKSGAPLTEADVYIAYGRFEQAEDVVKGALQDQPGDPELTAKLLEIYRVSGNTEAFHSLAAGFRESVGDDSPLWKKVAVMGYEMSPDEELYHDAGDTAVDLVDTEDLSAEVALAGDLESMEASVESGEVTDNTIEFTLDDSGESDLEDASEGQLDKSDEVGTKLDLARAYIDMSDPESARSILEEVLEEGNDQQKAEAEELFARLAEF